MTGQNPMVNLAGEIPDKMQTHLESNPLGGRFFPDAPGLPRNASSLTA